MRKVTLKLDAICAKLKKGLAEDGGNDDGGVGATTPPPSALTEVGRLKDSLRREKREANHNDLVVRSEETGETLSLAPQDRLGAAKDGLSNGSTHAEDTDHERLFTDGRHHHHTDVDDDGSSHGNNVQSPPPHSSSLFFNNSSFNNTGDDDESTTTTRQRTNNCSRDTPVLDRTAESEYRTSTPKSLSGASKRKSRGGAGGAPPARRLATGDNNRLGEDADYSNGLTNGGAGENGVSGVTRDEEGDDLESQESNHNLSMQNLPEGSSVVDNNINTNSHHTHNEDNDSNNDDFEECGSTLNSVGNGVAGDAVSLNADDMDDESDPWGDSQASQDPWDDDDDDADMSVSNQDMHSDPSDDDDDDSRKAIREYAERSAWDNDETPEIEEGLATNDVLCDVDVHEPSRDELTAPSLSDTSKVASSPRPATQAFSPPPSAPVLPFNLQNLHNLPPPPSYDAATMSQQGQRSFDQHAVKEYATDTMKELLGMYGYEEAGRDIDKQVALDDFSLSKYDVQIVDLID